MDTFAIAAVVLQEVGGGPGPAVLVLWLALAVAVVAGTWKTFEKADQPGWAALVPIYNLYVMLDIGDEAWWWLLVILFVPVVNLYGLYRMFRGVADAFGQGLGFALGLWFLGFVFFPLLGFGDYTYQGSPAATDASPSAAQA
ncbi:MAG: DUF5684 domain-containing protein [Halobacteriaceae archaeon]